MNNKPGQGCTVKKIIVQHLRNRVAKAVCAAAKSPIVPEVVNVEWTDCVNFRLSHPNINLRVIPDIIKNLMARHLRLRKHLYLDHNQTYGEMIINITCCRVLARNYMMKLLTEQWDAGQQYVHAMTNNGTSCHV